MQISDEHAISATRTTLAHAYTKGRRLDDLKHIPAICGVRGKIDQCTKTVRDAAQDLNFDPTVVCIRTQDARLVRPVRKATLPRVHALEAVEIWRSVPFVQKQQNTKPNITWIACNVRICRGYYEECKA